MLKLRTATDGNVLSIVGKPKPEEFQTAYRDLHDLFLSMKEEKAEIKKDDLLRELKIQKMNLLPPR